MECADLHLALTEGSHNRLHAHGMSTLPRARELMDVNLTGWGGVNLWGVRNLAAATERTAASDREFVSRLFHLLNQEWTWPGLTEGEEGCSTASRSAASCVAWLSVRCARRSPDTWSAA